MAVYSFPLRLRTDTNDDFTSLPFTTHLLDLQEGDLIQVSCYFETAGTLRGGGQTCTVSAWRT